MARGVLDIFLIYQFLRRLVTPFEQWDAFKVGLIDKEGKILVDKNNRTPEQVKSWGYYDRLLANLKKLLGKIPGGKTRIASFAAALLLLKEQNIDPDDIAYLEEALNDYMVQAEIINEEIANVVGSGKIAGVGVGPDGEPGVKKRKSKVLKRCSTASTNL
jgi:hypothetical protein